MLKGKKVILRNLEPDDLSEVYELSNDMTEIGPYWPMMLRAKPKFIESYNKNDGNWTENYGQLLILNKENKKVGVIHYFKSIPYTVGYEIGYMLYKDEDRGKGYMSEALALFRDFLFLSKNITRLQLCYFPENIPSIKVGEKNGFRKEGKLRQAVYHRGKYYDLLICSLLRKEWEKIYNK
ncbi:MAG: N-acetyltransferase [Candidatus Cloacimonadota bacterium]|nr:MAG: N-acetyltransferase [Candidatus Cloacimonadota bacterium]RLC52739.1 MAG: N-acetyltransferase [Candidatus Cloacimonadota bacterium]